MKKLFLCATAGLVLAATVTTSTRNLYSKNGKYIGKMQESSDGTTFYYGPQGEYNGKSQKLTNGQILLFDKNGKLVGQVGSPMPSK